MHRPWTGVDAAHLRQTTTLRSLTPEQREGIPTQRAVSVLGSLAAADTALLSATRELRDVLQSNVETDS